MPNLRDGKGNSLLMLASYNGHYQTARLLLERGAQVDARDSDGKTALMFAAMFNRVEIIDLLLAGGADAFRKTSDGKTAVESARAMGADKAAARLTLLVEKSN